MCRLKQSTYEMLVEHRMTRLQIVHTDRNEATMCNREMTNVAQIDRSEREGERRSAIRNCYNGYNIDKM